MRIWMWTWIYTNTSPNPSGTRRVWRTKSKLGQWMKEADKKDFRSDVFLRKHPSKSSLTFSSTDIGKYKNEGIYFWFIWTDLFLALTLCMIINLSTLRWIVSGNTEFWKIFWNNAKIFFHIKDISIISRTALQSENYTINWEKLQLTV